jgi:hypothetical protein
MFHKPKKQNYVIFVIYEAIILTFSALCVHIVIPIHIVHTLKMFFSFRFFFQLKKRCIINATPRGENHSKTLPMTFAET